jgi:hypothetical protein
MRAAMVSATASTSATVAPAPGRRLGVGRGGNRLSRAIPRALSPSTSRSEGSDVVEPYAFVEKGIEVRVPLLKRARLRRVAFQTTLPVSR